jgi:uncharacterized protein YcaQ
VPKEKRLFGYFALPVLVGEDIVAAIDLKTDRKNRELLVRKCNWIGKHPRKELKRRIEAELHRCERFQLPDQASPDAIRVRGSLREVRA